MIAGALLLSGAAVIAAAFVWNVRKLGGAVVAAMDAEEPLPAEWVNDGGPRVCPPRPRRGDWRYWCTR